MNYTKAKVEINGGAKNKFGDEHSLALSFITKEELSRAIANRSRQESLMAEKHVIAPAAIHDGPSGAWATIHKGELADENPEVPDTPEAAINRRPFCQITALIPGGPIECKGIVPCDELDLYTKVCFSIVATGPRAELHGPEHAFSDRTDVARRALWSVSRAIADNQPKGLLSYWSEKGVRLHGRSVTLEQARTTLGKGANVRAFVRLPCELGRPQDKKCVFGSYVDEEKPDELEMTLQGGKRSFSGWSLFFRRSGDDWKIDRIEQREH